MTDRTRRTPGDESLLALILSGTADLSGAACTTAPPELFDPPAHGETLVEAEYRHRAALAYCTRCPVIDRCATWAVTQPTDGMVRAGQPPRLTAPGRPKKAG